LGGLAVAAVLMALFLHRNAETSELPVAAAVAAVPNPATDGRIKLPVSATPPKSGERAIGSVLDVQGKMTFGDYVWNETGAAAGPIWVRVDLGRQLISVFRGGDEIGTAVILYGANGKETPLGEFPVLQKAVDYHSRTYDADMPDMLRLTADGVAIHASDVRQGWATHGCIGVPRAFAEKLFAAVKLGDPVTIVRG
jgi:hypothetical protein